MPGATDPIAARDPYEFVQLHRTFHELPKHSSEGDDLEISRAFHVGEHLHWVDLIKEYRLIILSEAGSGKTAEIHNVARTLREEGKSAFFLRLEHIPSDFEDAFEVGTYKAFQKWLASSEEGWLLLDSVDEARLRNPGDFELAIRRVGRRISTAMDRTHIVITSRTTAWRAKADLAHCIDHLPYAEITTSERSKQAEDGSPDASVLTETKKQDGVKPSFRIVALDDLTPDQIAVFAKAKGIENSKAFLDAVERADAGSFTSRPQDLEELTEFWIAKGRIGTRLELMQNSIDRRLAERDPDRATALPLSAERARHGARLLAAATTLAQNPTIRVPDGTENSKGIAVRSVLADWDEKDQSTLLSRPIFDEAIYGAVRFHHRSVREYLTAEWFAELLKCETSRRTIETLFFRNQYGLDIVAPTLRPILPWLAIMDEKIRERVRNVAPEIILEGGDPSQLPLEVRRHILHEICEQMADGTTDHSIRDYSAVQRFSSPDLTEDVRALIQHYAGNDDLSAFLLRMVWIGQLAGALPEAMAVALSPTAEKYVRISAFRAVKAVGSGEDREYVRKSFLAEASELRREWFAELLEGTQPTAQTIVWLLACIEKCELKERHTYDLLTGGVTEFVGTAAMELLPQLVVGLNELLSFPPVIEHRHCKVSEKFQWLIAPASKAVERLIVARHPASVEPEALSVLHKISAVQGYRNDGLSEIKADFSKLVPAWKELNWALFWFEVHQSREEREERLTECWRVSIFRRFWQFEEDDFVDIAKEIPRQTLLDNRLVALSLAFDLYRSAKRPRTWRVQLKNLVADNEELSERLKTYLSPPAQDRESRRWKQQEARWRQRTEDRRKKQEDYHNGWKKFLRENLDEARQALCENQETITSPLLYLFERSREKKNAATRWAEYNWKTLIPEYGEEVACFYRDGTVSFWRHHEPQLRSEGALFNETTHAVIIGLTGLEIEARESNGWLAILSAAEVERACRYASFEINGFPTWLPKLCEAHPQTVCRFLMREICYELSIEKAETDTHYIISGVSWSGQWAWDQIAPSVYELLKTTEPKNLANLDGLVKILQGSTLPDNQIEELASRKCRTLKRLDHVARWFAVWTGVAPESALSSLTVRIGNMVDHRRRTQFAMTFAAHLWGDRSGGAVAVRQAFKKPKYLRSLYLLMHEHIRRKEDVNRVGTGVYSPGLRDHAQDARNGLFELLNRIPGKESFLALMDIARVHPEEESRPWILLQARKRAEQDGDIVPWSPSQVRDFHDRLDCTPSNHRDLAELAILRLLDLKDDLEDGDSSMASILQTVPQETEMRKFIGRELREKAFGRYSIPQEEELADAKRPDLRFHGVGFDGPVPAELKIADNWTGPALFERLENQLCGDYLRDNRSSRGIFVLVYRGEKAGWDVPDSDNRVGFSGLTAALQGHWQRISMGFPNVDDLTVIGIDLTKRSS